MALNSLETHVSPEWAIILRNFQEAQCVPLDLVNICDGNMLKLITAHANAIGVAAETILMYLLTCIAGFLGKSCIKVNEDWKEQCALWCAIGVNKGLKKTSILTRFMNAIEEVEVDEDDDGERLSDGPEYTHKCIPDIQADYMNSEDFQSFFSKCQISAIGLHENVNIFVKSVLESRHPSHRQRLKRLYDVNSNKSKVPAFSLNGFIPLNQLHDFLNDIDISSRFLLMCPEEDILHSTEYKMPMPANTPALKEIFDVLARKHSTPLTYRLNEPALLDFIQYYDSLIPKQKQAQETGNEQSFCILNKSSGQLIRLACVIGALRQALKFVIYHEDSDLVPWNTVITRDDIQGAKLIWEHVLTTKVILLQENMIQKTTNCVANGGTNALGSMARSSPNSRKRPAEEPLTSYSKPQAMMVSTSGKPDLIASQPTGKQSDSQDNRRLMHAYGIPVNLGNPVFPEMMNMISSSPQGTLQSRHQAGLAKHGTQEGHGNGNHNIIPHVNHAALLQSNSMNARAMHQSLKMEQSFAYDDLEEEDDSDLSPLLTVQPVFDKDALSGSFSDEDVDAFIHKYGDRVKKLLDYKNDYKITPSTCAQRHLMPPLSKRDMMRLDTQTRFPVVWAKQFLNIVAKIGFGTIEVYLHPSNNRQSHYFQKKRFEDLSPRERELLARIRVTEQEFKAGFFHPNDGAPVPHVYVSRPFIPPPPLPPQQPISQTNQNEQRRVGNVGEAWDASAEKEQNKPTARSHDHASMIKAEPIFDNQAEDNLRIDLPPHLDESLFHN